jgi:gamma-glutamyl:cysteine ligase YbdK (ATP-grasp superfamily)
MDHEAFGSRTKNALRAQSDGRPEDAAAEIRALLRDLAPAAKAGINEWHQQQALGLLVDALDAAGREQECRAAWGELIQFTQDALTYWQEALASAREDFARWNQQHPSGTGSR